MSIITIAPQHGGVVTAYDVRQQAIYPTLQATDQDSEHTEEGLPPVVGTALYTFWLHHMATQPNQTLANIANQNNVQAFLTNLPPQATDPYDVGRHLQSLGYTRVFQRMHDGIGWEDLIPENSPAAIQYQAQMNLPAAQRARPPYNAAQNINLDSFPIGVVNFINTFRNDFLVTTQNHPTAKLIILNYMNTEFDDEVSNETKALAIFCDAHNASASIFRATEGVATFTGQDALNRALACLQAVLAGPFNELFQFDYRIYQHIPAAAKKTNTTEKTKVGLGKTNKTNKRKISDENQENIPARRPVRAS